MKKIFGILICLILLISGCGGGGGNGNDNNKTKIACVTGGHYGDCSDYTALLSSYNYQVVNIDINDLNNSAVDFSAYKLIIIGGNSGMSEGSANKIYNSGKPIIGVSGFGKSFFKKIPNASTNYPYLYNTTTTPNSTVSVTVKNKNDIIWLFPNGINTSDGSVTVAKSWYIVPMIYKENWTNNSTNISFGYSGSWEGITYDTLCLENKHYFLWAYSEPNMLTYEGKRLFANVVYYMLNL